MTKSYKLTVERTVCLLEVFFIEGDSEADARERFQHRLESRACSDIEDRAMWEEAFAMYLKHGDPYGDLYQVVDVIEED
jgi:hypothetical protein